MKIKEYIIDYIKENGISYEEIAARTGGTKQNVWNILNGKYGNKQKGAKGTHRPRFQSVKKICEAVGLTLCIEKRTGSPELDEGKIIKDEDLQDYPYDVIQGIIEKFGYEMTVKRTEEMNQNK